MNTPKRHPRFNLPTEFCHPPYWQHPNATVIETQPQLEEREACERDLDELNEFATYDGRYPPSRRGLAKVWECKND